MAGLLCLIDVFVLGPLWLFLKGKKKTNRAMANLSVMFLDTTFHSCSSSLTRSWNVSVSHIFISPVLQDLLGHYLLFFSSLFHFSHIPRRVFHFIEGGTTIVWGTHRQRCDLIGCKSTVKGQVSHSLLHLCLPFGIPSNFV